MGLWESVIIVTVFSIIVILADEWMHARRRKKRLAERPGQPGH